MRSLNAGVALVCVALCLSLVHAQKCATFQSLDKPRALAGGRCSNYGGSACCTQPTAKRAYDWVVEDDGCGVVTGQCAQFLKDFACALSCHPSLVVTGSTYTVNNTKPNNRAVICPNWAQLAYTACFSQSWCMPQNGVYSDCKTLALKTTVTRSKSGTTTSFSLVNVNFPDTCLPMAELMDPDSMGGSSGPQGFVENVLGAVYHPVEDGNCISPSYVPPGSAAALSIKIAAALVMLTSALFALA